MNAISSKSTFQVSQHDDGAGKGEKGFTAKCFMMGGVAVAAFALLIIAFLLSGQLDRVQAEMDGLQEFEAARSGTVVRLFEFDSAAHQALQGPDVNDLHIVISFFDDYLTSLANLSQLRLFGGQEERLDNIRRLSAEFRSVMHALAHENAGGNITEKRYLDALKTTPMIDALTELGTYNASLITERTAVQDTIRTINYVLIGLAVFVAVSAGLVMLVCMRRRLATTKREQEELLQSNQLLNREIEKKAADLNRVQILFDASLGVTSVTMFMQDRELVYSWVHGSVPGFLATSDVGRSDYDLIPGPNQEILIAAKLEVIATGKSISFESNREEDGVRRTYWVNLDPLIQDRAIIGIVGVMKDITERRRREDETQALLQELVHRAQNLLGVVLSMVKLSARSSTSLEAFSERFSGRISSMARSFEVLVDHDWQGAPIRALLDKSLATLDRRLQSRILIKGEDMQLNPLVAQNLALAFHELIANAIDHGSLSDGSGRVSITWSVQPCDSGAREFRFQWTEISAEPKTMEHDLVGFGRNVLETIVPRAINGEATLSNGPQGVIWTLTCPLDGFDGSAWSKPMSAAMTTLENTSTRAHNQPAQPAVEQIH